MKNVTSYLSRTRRDYLFYFWRGLFKTRMEVIGEMLLQKHVFLLLLVWKVGEHFSN